MLETFIIHFILAMVIASALAFLVRKQGVPEAQTVATMVGILGTFAGITLGLLDFDASNMGESVPQLIAGLQTAFATAIAGISVSLFVGLFGKHVGFSNSKSEVEEKSDLRLLEEVIIEMKQLNANISGDNETTLITQIQKLRTSINDKQDELKKSFDEFAQQMAENNMRALIDAVQKVMNDFNAKINDQIGENFKRLSEATENLIIWQDQYREQLGVATTALQEANKSLSTSVQSMGVFTDRAQDFDHAAQQLKISLEVMGASMTGLKNLADTLNTSGKTIRDEMAQITKENIMALGENLKGISEKLVEDYGHLQRMMQTVVDKQRQ